MKGRDAGRRARRRLWPRKDRSPGQVAARVIERKHKATLDAFVDTHAAPGPQLYTGDTITYEQGLI